MLQSGAILPKRQNNYFEIFAAVEMTFQIEMIVDGSVNRGEFL
jgi:hypothetical protein